MPDALAVWKRLADAGGHDGIAMVARSRADELTRLLTERERAAELMTHDGATVTKRLREAEDQGRTMFVVEVHRLWVAGDPYAAAALGAVYLDYVDLGHHSLLGRVERLIGLVYARQPESREAKSLYGRLAATKRRRETT